MPKEKIKDFLKDIEDEADKLAGWDELKIIGINKYGAEAVVRTDNGNIKMSMRDIFYQQNFVLRVFETLGISLIPVKQKVYEHWRKAWAERITEIGNANSTLDFLEETLEKYTENAEDREEAYLRNGEPIRITNDEVAFKANEFQMYLKKRHGLTYNSDELQLLLRDIGCNPKQIGKSRIRAWVYTLKDVPTGDETLFDKEDNQNV